ncbi:MAG: ATP-grasp domain-containing protein [Peptococcaceae bacterium]|nr:ATP-grasp domain-containing protein [Peptococcaceae bacterium]
MTEEMMQMLSDKGHTGHKRPDRRKPVKVGVAYNLKKETVQGPLDAEAEYDDPETVMAIKDALELSGCLVDLYEADEGLPLRLAEKRPEIVFNIAEGRNGHGREAQVPAILSFFGIPYIGSDEAAMCIAMDKALTKRLLGTYRIRTPRYRVIRKNLPGFKSGGLAYPLIVKPNAEGSGKGITDVSVVWDAAGLLRAVKECMEVYDQDMLIEEYIPGREFTVGLLGNGDSLRVFAPMEIIFRDKESGIYSYSVKRSFKQYVDYACPPDVGADLLADMEKTARRIFRIIGCRDFARIDFRLSPEGRLYFIEINPIPGLAPGYSDYPMLAEYCGVGYAELIREILRSALARYGMDLNETTTMGIEA